MGCQFTVNCLLGLLIYFIVFLVTVDENHKTRITPIEQPLVKDVEETGENVENDKSERKLNISGITFAKNKASSMVDRKHNALYQGRDSKFSFMSYRMQSKEALEPQQRHFLDCE